MPKKKKLQTLTDTEIVARWLSIRDFDSLLGTEPQVWDDMPLDIRELYLKDAKALMEILGDATEFLTDYGFYVGEKVTGGDQE